MTLTGGSSHVALHRRYGSPARALGPVLAVVVPSALTAGHALLYGPGWAVDDAAITWAYARSIVDGIGPFLQGGSPLVEGWSNPAWLAVFVVVAWLDLPLIATAKVLAVVCGAAMFAGFVVIARSFDLRRPDLVAGAAGCATAMTPSFVVWSFSGLENPLLASTAVWLAALLVRGPIDSDRVALGCGLLAAVAALTRPDGLLYVCAFPAVALACHRGRPELRVTALSVAAFTIPVAAYLSWRWELFGLLVPNTAVAKNQGPPTLEPVLELAQYSGLYLGAALTVTAVTWIARPEVRRLLLALLVPLTVAIAAQALLAPDWMGLLRFATPTWPLASLLGAIAVALIGSRRILALALGAAVMSAVIWTPSALAFRARPTVPACLIAQIDGHEINAYAQLLGLSSGTLLVPDVGGAALVGRMRVVDLAGLTDPVIAELRAARDVAGVQDHVYGLIRPTFIRAHGEWASRVRLFDDPRLALEYEKIGDIEEGAIFVRRDVLRTGDLDRLRAYRTEVAGPTEYAVRNDPGTGCSL